MAAPFAAFLSIQQLRSFADVSLEFKRELKSHFLFCF